MYLNSLWRAATSFANLGLASFEGHRVAARRPRRPKAVWEVQQSKRSSAFFATTLLGDAKSWRSRPRLDMPNNANAKTMDCSTAFALHSLFLRAHSLFEELPVYCQMPTSLLCNTYTYLRLWKVGIGTILIHCVHEWKITPVVCVVRRGFFWNLAPLFWFDNIHKHDLKQHYK